MTQQLFTIGLYCTGYVIFFGAGLGLGFLAGRDGPRDK